MKNRKLNCRGFLSDKALAWGENHVARAPRTRQPGGGMRSRGASRMGRLSSRSGAPLLPKHWSARMDAEALSRMRDELEVMRVLDEIGISWGF